MHQQASVDDMATIHINWDTGSSLGAAYGEDKIQKVLSYDITIKDGSLEIDYIGWQPEGGPWKKESESFSLCEGNVTDEQVNSEIAYRVERNKR